METATEKAMRSRCDSGVSEADRQMSRIRSGLDSDLRRASAARDFCLLVRGAAELGERMEEKWRRETARKRGKEAMEVQEEEIRV